MHGLQRFAKEEILDQHKKQYLLINDTQGVNYESVIIQIKGYEKKYSFFLKYMLTQSAF